MKNSFGGATGSFIQICVVQVWLSTCARRKKDGALALGPLLMSLEVA